MSSFALLFATREDRAEAVKAIRDYTVLVECRCGRYRNVLEACAVCGTTKERDERDERAESEEQITVDAV